MTVHRTVRLRLMVKKSGDSLTGDRRVKSV